MQLLMIDDDPAICELVRRVAEQIGYRVQTFIEADGFMKAVEQDDPDVIVLDLTMPDIDGIELLRYLSARQSAAQIFIMSGIHPTVRRMAHELGQSGNLRMAGSIPKPVRSADLRALLQQPLTNILNDIPGQIV